MRAIYFQIDECEQWAVAGLVASKRHISWMEICPDIPPTAKRDCELFLNLISKRFLQKGGAAIVDFQSMMAIGVDYRKCRF